MPRPYTNEQLLMAARLYYDDGLAQARVAKMCNVSQAKVSRMLALARKRGIVKITVQPYEARDSALESAIVDRLKLKSAIVINTPVDLRIEELRKTLGHFAAPDVVKMVPPGATIAVAGGRAMRELARSMNPTARDPSVVVAQTMGNVDENVASYDALELARTIAGRWGGSLLTLNTPALLPDRKTCQAIATLHQIRTVIKRLARATIAFVGVGTLQNSIFIDRGLFTKEDRDRLTRAGAVGEICGRYFDTQGRECETPYKNRVISIGLEELRKIPQVIAVVAGSDRTRAIIGAARGGIIKSLVIDQRGAEALMNSNESEAGR